MYRQVLTSYFFFEATTFSQILIVGLSVLLHCTAIRSSIEGRRQRPLTIVEVRVHIPIYTSMTQLLANLLGLIADHGYVNVMHCLHLV